ncbi:hypothetical protein [Candidatus Thioglobus sp.]|uniref:hypothetical protein n=1 Tax=Candidatus Thioglobus sp. TaxID=2026721 RepID=UPI001EC3C8AF|nr:hypothetical protein [Candidatus Thioglobus sp.]MBT3186792.1 hypothetical protein [Candidatus Thioglobus sp.]MBT6655875.1 hypothetical protein [Candidatus Thioglobus sp.]
MSKNMGKIVKLATLALVIIGLSACGRMGELEPVKAEKVTLSPAPAEPVFDIMPHSSK